MVLLEFEFEFELEEEEVDEEEETAVFAVVVSGRMLSILINVGLVLAEAVFVCALEVGCELVVVEVMLASCCISCMRMCLRRDEGCV